MKSYYALGSHHVAPRSTVTSNLLNTTFTWSGEYYERAKDENLSKNLRKVNAVVGPSIIYLLFIQKTHSHLKFNSRCSLLLLPNCSSLILAQEWWEVLNHSRLGHVSFSNYIIREFFAMFEWNQLLGWKRAQIIFWAHSTAFEVMQCIVLTVLEI